MNTKAKVDLIRSKLYLNISQIADIVGLTRQALYSSILFDIDIDHINPLVELCDRIRDYDMRGKVTSIMYEQRTFLGWLRQKPFNVDDLVFIAKTLHERQLPVKTRNPMDIHELKRANMTSICKR